MQNVLCTGLFPRIFYNDSFLNFLFFFFKKRFHFRHAYVWLWLCVGLPTGMQVPEEVRGIGPPAEGLESHTVLSCRTWVLRIEPGSLQKSSDALNHGTIPPIHKFYLLLLYVGACVPCKELAFFSHLYASCRTQNPGCKTCMVSTFTCWVSLQHMTTT